MAARRSSRARERLLVAADDLREFAQALSDPWSSTLRIGVIPTVGPYCCPSWRRCCASVIRSCSGCGVKRRPVCGRQLARAEIDGALLALEARGSTRCRT